MRPVIGVTAWMETAEWLGFEGKAALLEETYLLHITKAGGVPVIVPPYPEFASEIVGTIDALVIGGGEDVDPALYGAEHQKGTAVSADKNQDAGEMAVIEAAIQRGIPVLGICRGCQVLNVLYGGTLVQDLEKVEDGMSHVSSDAETKRQTYLQHPVHAEPNSVIAGVLGDEFMVESWHHQGVDRVGEGLTAIGRAEDGLVEAIADPGQDFVIGVQWHPEAESGNRIFEALVEAARRGADARRSAVE